MTSASPRNTATLVLFSFTLFLSAALMFGLQPMVGKMLLPIVGGTPSGWIVAMAFFQVMLLAGYFLAHALSRFTPRMQAALYIACLGVGALFLPTNLAAHTGLVSETPMEKDVFILLTAVVAVPFIALSATASTLQRLFTTTGHASAKDPYFLYVASNLGSFAGLLLYPFLIEPRLPLTLQSWGWLEGYALLIGLAVLCLLLSGKAAAPAKKKPEKTYAPVSWEKRLEWIGLAFLPSGLLLAVTTHITTDILSVPLLWVLPLSLYLLTFVIAFSKRTIIPYKWALHVHPVAVSVALALLLAVTDKMALTSYALGLHLAAFTVTALMCHMRLARLRPVEDDSRHLTEFYLMLAVGGALGGVLNAFVAPVIFDRLTEYPLMLLASAFCNENIRREFSTRYVGAFLTGCIVAVIFALTYKQGSMPELNRNIFMIAVFILLMLHPKTLLATGSAFALFVFAQLWLNPPVLTARNFYGVIKVYDKILPIAPEVTAQVRYMQNGTTLHGMQIMRYGFDTVPTTYYTKEGPLGDIMNLLKPVNIASIGLGAGTTNCYAEPGRKITFFDINPDVVKIAHEKFTYLKKCGEPRIILGDARLEIKKLRDEKFDLIILDAFSSDNIPTHLLTIEAIRVYLDHLTPEGIILFHISNRHFTLDGPIAAAGQLLGLQNAVVLQNRVNSSYAATSRWMALARPDVDFLPLGNTQWVRATVGEAFRPWTDDYTNLLSVMEF